MPRGYFLETNTLLGLTFYSDRWFRDIRPIYDTEYEFYTSELVLYEYCNSEHSFTFPPSNPQNQTLSWDTERGRFRKITNDLKRPLSTFTREIRGLSDESLTLTRVMEEFIDQFSIRKEAEPQIREKFESHFENRELTTRYVNKFVGELIDDILSTAKKNKQSLKERVKVQPSVYHKVREMRRKWQDLPGDVIHEPDQSILVDATNVINNNGANHLVTGDSDILQLQKIANEYYNFTIVSMTDQLIRDGKYSVDGH